MKNKLILISLVVAFACGASVFALLYFEAAIALFERANLSWLGTRAATGQAFRIYAVAALAGSAAGVYLAIGLGTRIVRRSNGQDDHAAMLAGGLSAALIVAFALFITGDAAFSAIDYYGWPFLVALSGFAGLVVWLKHALAARFDPGALSS